MLKTEETDAAYLKELVDTNCGKHKEEMQRQESALPRSELGTAPVRI
jgi:hypothetical protein